MNEVNVPFEAIVTLGIYVIASTVGFVWWMATITEQIKNLSGLIKEMSTTNGLYARKEDVVRELSVIEKQQETMWEKLDKVKEKVDSLK